MVLFSFFFSFFALTFLFITPMATCVGFLLSSFLVNNVFPVLNRIELVSLEHFWNRMKFWVELKSESWPVTRSRVSVGFWVGAEFIKCDASFPLWAGGRG